MIVHSAASAPMVESRPDWGLAAPTLVFAGVCTLLLTVAPKLLGDADTQWHIAAGAWIWAHMALPWTDPFSHTFAGQPWIAKEWLSQLVMFGAWRIGGWIGVVLVTAASLGLLYALMLRWLTERCSPVFALLLTMLAVVFLAQHFLARPHVFAFLTLFLWTRGLLDAIEKGRTPSPALLFVLVVWANLHGSITIAYPIAGLLGLEAIARTAPAERLSAIIRWGAFGALALAAGCATPYGIQSVLMTFALFGSGEPLPYITEWQPLGFGFVAIIAYATAFMFTIGLAAAGWRNAARIALLALLTVMMVRHARFLDVFGVVAPLLVATPFARRFPELGTGRELPGDVWPLPAKGALAALALIAVAALVSRPIEPAPDVTPRAALAAARAAGVGGPVYNSYDFGGFLIAEGVPTFIDGRTDQLFLGGFISTVMSAARAEDGRAFADLLSRWGVEWALVRTGDDEARHLDAMPGWRRVHRDTFASAYIRSLRGTLP